MLTKPIKNLVGGSITASLLLPLGGGVAYARDVTNVASIDWQQGNQQFSRPSNEVKITVQNTDPIVDNGELTFYNLTNSSQPNSMPIGNTQCVGAGGIQPVKLSGAYSGFDTNSPKLQQVSGIHAGEPLVVSINVASANTNAAAVDQYRIILETTEDREELILSETGVNTGVFAGFLNTKAIPPAAETGDCVLSVRPNSRLTLTADDGSSATQIASGAIDILIDPFGLVFDSDDGAPVNGAVVTLIDNATGLPATVFGDDGVSAFPSSVTTGSSITDASGAIYNFDDGYYRFPFARPGDYSLQVTPPAPYSYTSNAPITHLNTLTRPDGQPMTLLPASFGGAVTLDDPAPVRVDIPVDKPGQGALVLTKRAHRSAASAGDYVRYNVTITGNGNAPTGNLSITDTMPTQMRLRPDSITWSAGTFSTDIAPNGRGFTLTAPALAGGQTANLSYIAEVRPDAAAGVAVNSISASDDRGRGSNIAEASVKIEPNLLGERLTIIGRVTEEGCTVDPRNAKGIAGVRVMLEDGTYTVTDKDGRYHFEGIRPGKHVVQIDPESLPLDRAPALCATNTRAAGSPISRFVEGSGGVLKRADFYAVASEPRAKPNAAVYSMPEAISDSAAAGAETDWLAGQKPGTEFLFPVTGYNPRLRTTRAVFKHTQGTSVKLLVNGQATDPLLSDGTRSARGGSVQVSSWRALPLRRGENQLTAIVLDTSGNEVSRTEQTVVLAGPALQARLLREKSYLVADGVNRPVIAVAMTDRDGNPIPNGARGKFSVPAPYEPATNSDEQGVRDLAGIQRQEMGWQVIGDEGIAYIQLQPTTASGSLAIGLSFQDGEVSREQKLNMWLEAADRPWTVVGIASASFGFNHLTEAQARWKERGISKDEVDGRIAFYARGNVTGKWQMTVAYDSDKQRDDNLLSGQIDPRSYYTIYADRAEQRYDAASLRKLYARIERPDFYAMFGDFQTGINDTQLTRYQRSLNGFKAEYGTDELRATAFVADSATRYSRDEIQGIGLTGPYRMKNADIVPNSERITIQKRDRLRSDRIVGEQVLVRYIDYDIDYVSGLIRLKEPLLSRDFDNNPQFIIAEYEVNGIGRRLTSAGVRLAGTTKDEKARVGFTAIQDKSEDATSRVIGADVRIRPDMQTEIRAEVAYSKSTADIAGGENKSGNAWLVEAEHHSGKFDFLAYARRQAIGFGLGQQNDSENGTEKVGIEARARITRSLSVGILGYREKHLVRDTRRNAGSAEVEWRGEKHSLTAGLIYANDRLADRTNNKSLLAKLAGSVRVSSKLELNTSVELPISDKDASVDFPARYTAGARYQLTNWLQLVGTYERAEGGAVTSDSFRAGFDMTPWSGGKINAAAGQQQITEFGNRAYAAYGLLQNFQINENLTIDFSLDGNYTLSGINRGDVMNEAFPTATSGLLTSTGLIDEDFVAVTAGASYHKDRWALTARAEYRDADTSKRYGLNAGFIRELGEGQAIGGLATYAHATGVTGSVSEVAELAASWANRPANSRWSWLAKTELRQDRVVDAIAGDTSNVTGTYLISGDARSRRAIASVSVNYTPTDTHDDGNVFESGEYSFFYGTRYVSEKFGDGDISGWSHIAGVDARYDITKSLDIGLSASARIGNNFDSISYSFGPTISFAPEKNMNLRLGYNVVGYEDRDFSDSGYTRNGVYIGFDLKFDQTSFDGLGL